MLNTLKTRDGEFYIAPLKPGRYSSSPKATKDSFYTKLPSGTLIVKHNTWWKERLESAADFCGKHQTVTLRERCINPLFVCDSRQSLPTLLGLDIDTFTDIYSSDLLVVKDPGGSPFVNGETIEWNDFCLRSSKGEGITVYGECEVFEKLLAGVDLEKQRAEAISALEGDTYTPKEERQRLRHMRDICTLFLETGAKPEWLFVDEWLLPSAHFAVKTVDGEPSLIRRQCNTLYNDISVLLKPANECVVDHDSNPASPLRKLALSGYRRCFNRILCGIGFFNKTENGADMGHLFSLFSSLEDKSPSNPVALELLHSMCLDYYEVK